ncbi:hypothetical protein BJ741DRAFT_616439 [Chytriomyces cf. hyalinus JEL632]|nr:hypothetical protein BJ741DRAFT_616439 [Chytriomyces cf. hyalinus JEL632]
MSRKSTSSSARVAPTTTRPAISSAVVSSAAAPTAAASITGGPMPSSAETSSGDLQVINVSVTTSGAGSFDDSGEAGDATSTGAILNGSVVPSSVAGSSPRTTSSVQTSVAPVSSEASGSSSSGAVPAATWVGVATGVLLLCVLAACVSLHVRNKRKRRAKAAMNPAAINPERYGFGQANEKESDLVELGNLRNNPIHAPINGPVNANINTNRQPVNSHDSSNVSNYINNNPMNQPVAAPVTPVAPVFADVYGDANTAAFTSTAPMKHMSLQAMAPSMIHAQAENYRNSFSPGSSFQVPEQLAREVANPVFVPAMPSNTEAVLNAPHPVTENPFTSVYMDREAASVPAQPIPTPIQNPFEAVYGDRRASTISQAQPAPPPPVAEAQRVSMMQQQPPVAIRSSVLQDGTVTTPFDPVNDIVDVYSRPMDRASMMQAGAPAVSNPFAEDAPMDARRQSFAEIYQVPASN